MKIGNDKTSAIAITILLTLSMAAAMMLVPSTSAHSPGWQIATWSYINVAPNPVGVGQSCSVEMWVDKITPSAGGSESSAATSKTTYGDLLGNFTVTVTTPAATTTTLGPYTAYPTAGYATYYTPATVGNYTFVFHFGGTLLEGKNPPPSGQVNPAYIGDYYEPSVSQPFVLTVTSTQLQPYPYNPLPTSYWARPICGSGDLGWNVISGNVLGWTGGYSATGDFDFDSFNPYTYVPQTAHVLWTKSETNGGLIGGEMGNTESGSSYFADDFSDAKFSAIIINGVLYYTNWPLSYDDPVGWSAVNLNTGQTIWGIGSSIPSPAHTSGSYSNDAVLRNGQTDIWTTDSCFGGEAYLWATTGTTYMCYDAVTGEWLLNITSVTLGTLVEDTHGDICDYYINATSHTLNLWNSTDAIINYQFINTAGYPNVVIHLTQTNMVPIGVNIPFKDGIEWAAPIPTTYAGNAISLAIGKVDLGIYAGDNPSTPVVLASSTDPINVEGTVSGWRIEAGFNALTGAELWITNRTLVTWGNTGFATACYNGIYAEVCQETGQWWMYSSVTGTLLWGPVVSPVWLAWDSEDATSGNIAYGLLITCGLGGDVTAFNATNGAVVWTWKTPPSGLEAVYGDWDLWSGTGSTRWSIAGTGDSGAIFVASGHEYNVPQFQGAQQYVINATTGKLMWSDLGYYVSAAAAISDGICVNFNTYMCQIWAWGQGPSSTTVTAPDVGVTTATPVTLRGTVLDISAGTKQNTQAMMFPNGVPCVSDASQEGFMDYLYEGQLLPSNTTGVPVTLSVIDPNGNYRVIGNTTTDPSTGMFTYTWTPDITGAYTVIATFAGSGAYYGSSATSSFYASAPAPTASPYPTISLSPTGVAIADATVAIIVVIIIIGVLIILLQRRKP